MASNLLHFMKTSSSLALIEDSGILRSAFAAFVQMSTQWYQASNFLVLLWELFRLHGPSDSRQSQRLQDLWTVLRTSWPVSIRATLLPSHRDYCGGGHVTSLAKEMDTTWGAPGEDSPPWQKEQATGEESTAARTPAPSSCVRTWYWVWWQPSCNHEVRS